MRDRSINGFVVLALMLGIVCGWTLRRMVILSAPEAADPAPPDAAARVQVAYQHVVTLTEQRAFLNKALAGLAPQPDDTADVLPMVPDTVSAHATEPSVEVPAAAPAEVPAPALPVEVPAPALPVEVPAAPAQPPASSAQPPAAQAQRPVPAEEPKAPTTPSVAGAAAAQTAAAPTQSAKGLAKAVAYSPRPSAGPGRWRCTRAGGCKYVFYVMPFVGFLGEQFSQQRLAVMETIHIVKVPRGLCCGPAPWPVRHLHPPGGGRKKFAREGGGGGGMHWKGGGTPLQGAQPMSSHCLPGGK